MSTVKMKQLKKNDFLATVTEEPMTREQLVDALEEFEFIGSYLDYLTDHFEAQGKILKNEDGTIQRKATKVKGVGIRDLYRVAIDLGGSFEMEKQTLGKGEYYNDACKAAGWRQSEAAAAKVAKQQVFKTYKEQSALINGLLELIDPAEDEAA